MQVRLLTGTFFSPDGWATNDFETLSSGDINDAVYTFLGTDTNNGCTWSGPATFFQR